MEILAGILHHSSTTGNWKPFPLKDSDPFNPHIDCFVQDCSISIVNALE